MWGQLTCSCLTREPENSSIRQKVKYNLKNSKAVFSGRVVGIRKKDDSPFKGYLEIQFEVERSWKNAEIRVLRVMTVPAASCGYDFKVGQDYLVYATSSGKLNLLVGFCSRTRELKHAADDLRVLSRGKTIL